MGVDHQQLVHVSFFIGIQFLTSIKAINKKEKDYGIGETLKLDKILIINRFQNL